MGPVHAKLTLQKRVKCTSHGLVLTSESAGGSCSGRVLRGHGSTETHYWSAIAFRLRATAWTNLRVFDLLANGFGLLEQGSGLLDLAQSPVGEAEVAEGVASWSSCANLV